MPFMHPMFMHPVMHPMFVRCTPCRSSSSCGASPFLLALLAFLFLPMLARVALVLLHVAFHVVMPIALAMLVCKACACCDEDATCGTATADPAQTKAEAMKACFAKMKAGIRKECVDKVKESCGREQGTVRETLAKKAAAARRIDLSTVRFEASEDGVRLTVAAPGVKPSDLDVSFVEHTLRITGATTREAETYTIERSVVVPPCVDLATAQCDHADGALTITIKKYPEPVATRIPVASASAARPVEVVAAEPVVAAAAEAVPDEAAEAKAGESSEGEWEPLGKEE